MLAGRLFAVALMVGGLAAAPARSAEEALAPAYPFKIALPDGFKVEARPRGPDFFVYDVFKGDQNYVGIYLGCCANFPIKEGVRVENRAGGLKVALRGKRVVEYLWPGQTHVWVIEGEKVEAAVADRIAASVRSSR